MAETIRHAPMQMPMTVTTGGWALAAGAVAEVTGSQTGSLTLAIVAGAFLLGAAIITPIVKYWLDRRSNPVDHRNELITEQAEFIEHLRAELVEARSELADAHEQIRRRPRA